MNGSEEKLIDDKPFWILVFSIITGLIASFSLGISGNDFWWHVKAGEWMVNNRALPTIDIFSWYAKEKGLIWASHEWMSQVLFYLIHSLTHDIGIFLFSLGSAIAMAMLILFRSRQAIRKNIAFTIIYLAPMVVLFRFMFYGRPHLISYFLIYATLFCLYRYKESESSRLIYFIPVLSVLWGNLHGGSSTLSYILCFIFFVSGALEFSFGKLHGEKLSRKQLITILGVGILSLFALALNPYGVDMIVYPYANMGDAFMQDMINEWAPPDAKQITHLVLFFWPMLIVSLSLVITDKKVKVLDLLLFLFFAYMFFRSVRFGVVFYIASTFFTFDYLIFRESKSVKTRYDKPAFMLIVAALILTNVLSIKATINTVREGKLISSVLDKKIIEFVKRDAPKRLFNDYNFGESLIYNDIETFADARADLFSPHNLRDTRSLSNLVQSDEKQLDKIFDPEKIIEKYDFDAFLIRFNHALAVYLKSHPQKYKLVLATDNAVYYRRIKHNLEHGVTEE
ncbi:MAG: hypothetical protein GQF41_3658 [Candidatus Rifleibacterium amylolyticum]|nr:MAG: hypothetical protein GQF41_3658 [Candidatus Rifleibacterium amylolyticum]